MLSSLARWWRRKRRPPSLGRPGRSRLVVEALEDRVLLSHIPLTPEFLVGPNPATLQATAPAVAVSSDAVGDFVVAWTAPADRGRANVFAQLYNRDGVARGKPLDVSNGLVFGPLSKAGVTVDVAMDAAGAFVVAYDSSSGQRGDRILVHRYDAAGSDLGAFTINPRSDSLVQIASRPSVATDSAGNFVVAFTAEVGESAAPRVLAERFSAAGTPEGGLFQVSAADAPPLTGPSVAEDGAGNFVVTWNADADGPEIVARRFTATGTALDAQPFVVSTDATDRSTADVGVARDGHSFVITWDVNEGIAATTVHAQRFDAAGQPIGGDFIVNSAALDVTAPPHVGVDAHGDFAIDWSTGQGPNSVSYRFFTADGLAEGPQVKVNALTTDRGPNDVAVNDSGDFVVAWSGFQAGQDGPSVLARIYRTPEAPPVEPPSPAPPPPLPPTSTPTPTPAPTPTPTPMPVPQTHALVVPPPAQPPSAALVVSLPAPVQTDPDAAMLIALARIAAVAKPIPMDPFAVLTFSAPPPAASNPALTRLVGGPLPMTLLSGGGKRDMVGEISGRVFEDLNGNGIQDEGERGVAGQVVFLDLNDNGIRDPSEPFMVTDAEGRYNFGGLPLTYHTVRQDLGQPRLRQTTPENNAAHIVVLTPQINSVAGKDFGARTSPVAGTDTQPAPQDDESEP